MREPACPNCSKKLGDHKAGRCMDQWLAELVMGYVWVKFSETYPHHRPDGRFLADPEHIRDLRSEVMSTAYVQVEAAGPVCDDGALLKASFLPVPKFSSEDAQVVPVIRRMGKLGFNGATVHYAAEGRWKSSFVHKVEARVVGVMTHESVAYAVTFAAIEAADMLKMCAAAGHS